MYILFDDLSKICSDVTLANILLICKRLLRLIQIIGPILAIVALAIVFVRYVINPEDKKLKNKIKNCLLALVLLFLTPTIVNMVMVSLDDRFSISTCWNYDEEVQVYNGVTYIDTSAKRQNIVTDPSGYEHGAGKSEIDDEDSIGKGMGKAKKITIKYNVKDKGGRCGTYPGDKCAEIATVKYEKGTVKYYMGYQNNSKLLSGSCRSHAFTCGMNATNNTNYSTLDLQNFLYSSGDEGVLKGKSGFNKVINHFNVKAKAYFNETSISKSISLARKALDNGQPVLIFVANSKCSDLASTHHTLLLLGYDNNDNVVFLDSCLRYPSAKKRTLQELGKCMSGDTTAKNWMRMVIFSF